MKRRINRILNIVMGSFAGVFLGSGLFRYWHYRKYPDLYAMQSAPWYVSILVNCVFTLALLAVCMIGKILFLEQAGALKKTAFLLGILICVLAIIGGGYVLLS